MDFETPLAKVRGLGSAQSGTFHWWMQRVTAVALLPLSFVFVQLLNASMTLSYEQIIAWLSTPFNTACIVAWILTVFYHAALGLQVVIEDYVAHEAAKIIAIWSVNLVFGFLALLALLAVLRTILVG
jgi:succinate dehydrogenase / fumarate reductase membrane anchor subunit